MDKKYEPLFTPWKIGNVEIKNRIVMTSMGGTSIFGWLEPNHFDKEAANFLLERAKNNVGLILPGIAPIKDIILGKWLYQGKGKFKELKEFMDEFHKTGCKMFVQMTAGFGRSMAINDIMVKACKNKALGLVMKPILDMDYLTASASATPNRWEESCMSRPLTKKEIDEMVDAFARTAKLCRNAILVHLNFFNLVQVNLAQVHRTATTVVHRNAVNTNDNVLRIMYRGEIESIIIKDDLIVSTFFLLSRYDEYRQPEAVDMHHRFVSGRSFLGSHGLLQTPIVDQYTSFIYNESSRS